VPNERFGNRVIDGPMIVEYMTQVPVRTILDIHLYSGQW
jgi:hypothetical protein